MARCGIKKVVVFPLNELDSVNSFQKSNDKVLRLYQENKDNIIPFFRLNPLRNWRAEFKRCSEKPFRGIKLHPRSQGFGLDSSATTRIYEEAEEHNLIVLIHAGIGMSNIAQDILRVAKEFKKLKLILAHAAFIDIENAITDLVRYKNVNFDLSAVPLFDIYDLLQNLDRRRVLYGSDIPYRDCEYTIEAIVHVAAALDLRLKEFEMIFSENLKRLLR